MDFQSTPRSGAAQSTGRITSVDENQCMQSRPSPVCVGPKFKVSNRILKYFVHVYKYMYVYELNMWTGTVSL